ncbi:protein FAM221B isoform X2 [Rattus norvegicus]|uniref:protein FAM221B isoform X2 n=1 Tax=Rattus norvegicus TaxID=10116 RepID=UPI0008102C55|nr:protein FAM221B isoform X2 [Rattus norvegicus]|eukprot:XP_017448761.1 PREDICTED: protein FAM221B isoform X2 [Rattus norvegicus]
MDLEPPGLSPEMEADKTSEGPPATQDAKKHPSLTVPHAEDLPEATTPESPPHLLSSQEYFQPPKVHSKTYPSLDLGTKDSEDLQDPSVSETPLKLDTANLPSTPSQSSAQSVISLERAISKIPLDDFIYENSISEVQEEPLPLSPTTDISKYEYPISDVQEEPLLLSPTTNISKYEDSISDVQEEPLEDTPTADISETEYSISDVQEEPLEPPPTADIPESEDYISDDHEEPLEPPPTADIPESSYEFISDKVPQTQVPESEPFPKHSVPEPSAQAKEAASADEEEAEEEELTGGTSKTAAAGSEHHARKKKEKRGGGCESRPVVPAKRAELVEMAKAMHRKQFDDQVNDLFQWEKNSSLKAIQTGIYIGWRCPHYLWDCFRIGDESKCFCGHLLKEHQIISDLSVPCSVSQCRCLMFCFIPSRPEEVGEFWLKKRATFDPKAWRAQCRCKHTHEEHAATGSHPCRHRGCYCNSFESNFLCAACDRRWEEHETFFETEETKRRGKRPYGTNTAKNRHRPF